MNCFYALRPLILASGSPRRRELLASAGVAFQARPSPLEPEPLPGEAPAAYARRAARSKAEAVLRLLEAEEQGAALLAADTIVTLDGRILGKPASPSQALEMLRFLAGRAHTVITACCLFPSGRASPAPVEFARKSRVSFWNPPPEALQVYAHGPDPLDKAGGYAAQGGGTMLVRSVSGSWSNVVGLPLSETLEVLLANGIIAPSPAGAEGPCSG